MNYEKVKKILSLLIRDLQIQKNGDLHIHLMVTDTKDNFGALYNWINQLIEADSNLTYNEVRSKFLSIVDPHGYSLSTL